MDTFVTIFLKMAQEDDVPILDFLTTGATNENTGNCKWWKVFWGKHFRWTDPLLLSCFWCSFSPYSLNAQSSGSNQDILFDLIVWKGLWIILDAFRSHFDNSLQPPSQGKASKISYLEKQRCWFLTLSCCPLKAIKLPGLSLFTDKGNSCFCCLATQKQLQDCLFTVSAF